MAYSIKLDGEIIEPRKVYTGGYLPLIDLGGRRDWYLAESSDEAGEKAAEYWQNMADKDPKEFRCLVGDETLISWGMGQYAGPGANQYRSATEWIESWKDIPEEQWGSCDSSEIDVEIPEGFLVDGDIDEDMVEAARQRLANDESPDASGQDEWVVGFADLCEELGFVPRVAYRHN